MKSFALCAVLLLLCAVFVRAQQDAPEIYLQTGQRLPDFTITDLDGKEYKSADFKGKVVFIYFWTTWCPYCRAEMQLLEREIWQKYKSDDFVMLAVAREQSDEEAANYRKNARVTFPVAADRDGKIFDLFAGHGIPRSYIADTNGTIVFQIAGLDESQFDNRKRALQKALKNAKKQRE